MQMGRRARPEAGCSDKCSKTKRRSHHINVGPFEFLRTCCSWRRMRKSKTIPRSISEGPSITWSAKWAHFCVWGLALKTVFCYCFRTGFLAFFLWKLTRGFPFLLFSGDIFFKDSVSGVKAGVAVGMPVVGLATRNPEKHLLDAGASFVIKDFDDQKLWSALEEYWEQAKQERPIYSIFFWNKISIG